MHLGAPGSPAAPGDGEWQASFLLLFPCIYLALCPRGGAKDSPQGWVAVPKQHDTRVEACGQCVHSWWAWPTVESPFKRLFLWLWSFPLCHPHFSAQPTSDDAHFLTYSSSREVITGTEVGAHDERWPCSSGARVLQSRGDQAVSRGMGACENRVPGRGMSSPFSRPGAGGVLPTGATPALVLKQTWLLRLGSGPSCWPAPWTWSYLRLIPNNRGIRPRQKTVSGRNLTSLSTKHVSRCWGPSG